MTVYDFYTALLALKFRFFFQNESIGKAVVRCSAVSSFDDGLLRCAPSGRQSMASFVWTMRQWNRLALAKREREPLSQPAKVGRCWQMVHLQMQKERRIDGGTDSAAVCLRWGAGRLGN